MAKRRSKKKIKSAVTLIIVIILAIISYFTEPWKYIDEGKKEIGHQTEVDVNDLQVHYIDVGQADSILIRVPTEDGTENMLIDAGTSSGYSEEVILNYLNDLGISTLTYMVITHPHEDHAQAAAEVVENFDIENIILPECESDKLYWIDFLEAMDEKSLSYIPGEIGDTYSIGDASFTILGPVDASAVKSDTNNYSVVIRLDYGETSFVFTGDAEQKSEKAMLAALSASEFKCDVLKVGHHGSTTSTCAEFLAATDPSLAIISCGKDNDYGHPNADVVERLEGADVSILRTDLEGTIIICSDKTKVYRLTSE